MTILVGVRCSDGVAIGADGIATSAMGAFPLMHMESDPKIRIFGNSIILATTGPIGYTQRLYHHVEAAVKGQVGSPTSAR